MANPVSVGVKRTKGEEEKMWTPTTFKEQPHQYPSIQIFRIRNEQHQSEGVEPQQGRRIAVDRARGSGPDCHIAHQEGNGTGGGACSGYCRLGVSD